MASGVLGTFDMQGTQQPSSMEQSRTCEVAHDVYSCQSTQEESLWNLERGTKRPDSRDGLS